MSPYQLQVRKCWSNTTPRTLKTPQRSLRVAAVRPDQPASFPDLSIHPRCYSEATMARVASKAVRSTGIAQRRPMALLLHVHPTRLWAGTDLQNFWCARRDSNPHDFTHCHLKAARLPIPPRALKRSAKGLPPDRINGADVTNQGWGDKAREHSVSGIEQGRSKGADFSGCPAISAAFA
jgi:hypothetical protein